ncbi:hypothetical protein SAMN02927921_03966 [Sinomicrobium oceani]|uniref:DUF4350 domain-containing protein n=1 Tax=Sinomicrobium oceani TaxID=1150368 RepID=A0A1K1RSU0_9FLAO|nr:DUF4350 domain-containing protein [Sinomicrobium oceani]SFW75145.1 hypothetical protein SAMN02927921_03966 [Sinomicrobium oceani]
MKNSIKIYIGLLVLLFIVVAVFELSGPDPVNWTPTFNEQQSRPYALKVLYSELPELFPGGIEDVKVTPYEHLRPLYQPWDSVYSSENSYIYINRIYVPDVTSTHELLNYVSSGNTVFIASESMPQELTDSLDFTTEYDFGIKRKGSLYLANRTLKKDSVSLEEGMTGSYFTTLDSVNTTVLGYQDFGTKRINFVKIAYGKGYFLLHSYPYAFTNYYVLKDKNYRYVADVLSYIPGDTVYFDCRDRVHEELGNSPLRYILSQPALRWAWYIALASLLVFMIFNAKRKQRIIKVIPPEENTTVAFTKTIGNLYYETRDHTNLVDKKITYFLEKIRSEYLLDTNELDDRFIRYLAAKTGKNKDTVKKLVSLIVRLQSKTHATEEDLLELNRAIEQFYMTNTIRKEQ